MVKSTKSKIIRPSRSKRGPGSLSEGDLIRGGGGPGRIVTVKCKFGLYKRPALGERVLLHLAAAPANEDRHIFGAVPAVATLDISQINPYSLYIGVIFCQFTTTISNKFYLILNFENALGVQSIKPFSRDDERIYVDFTNPREVKGGDASLMNPWPNPVMTKKTRMPKFVPVGETTKDGQITTGDASVIKPHYGSQLSPFDINGDGIVDEDDMEIVKECYQKRSAVEIPSALNWVR